MKPTICSIVACRNDLPYLKRLVPWYDKNEIDLYIIDNDSSDGSLEYLKYNSSSFLRSIYTLPYHGFFSLTEQLNKKFEILNQLKYDWIIHQDVDEILQPENPNYSLRTLIEEVDRSGYNTVNFEELVFLPDWNIQSFDYDYESINRNYYYFAPSNNRLNRIWKNGFSFSSIRSGGHTIINDQANIKVYPKNQILKHYIVLNQRHAYDKYLKRTFDPFDLDAGWHRNRLNFTIDNLYLNKLSNHRMKNVEINGFDFTQPADKHFWEWI